MALGGAKKSIGPASWHWEIQTRATKKLDTGPFGIWLSASFLPLRYLLALNF
jgi:hypothetical protein